ncbi:hypothetical protein GCU56_15915 [Geodermatophilus sabuli]|uniref:Oligosaccharide repeat unit polymerase n=1 Tax=Geodermatophilus sabuli TaxID=1564158 RepID=A0A7K3W3W7_9ACTN|nr:hypothetical protein [Geodermatophilus sabuli]NEK59348.1 hypothetical protein [Geodermatophilus sabuli]
MIGPLLAVAASFVVWGLVYRSLVVHPLDAMALTLYYLALQLLWRPLMLALGLDTPFPTLLFEERDTETLLLVGQAVVVGFLLALWAGARLLSPLVRPVTVLYPQLRGPMAPRTLVVLTVVLTAAAFVATAALWVRYGGPSGLLQASKVDRDIADSRALRAIPMLAALLGVAAFFSVRGARLQRLMIFGLIAVNGYLSWTWGARDVPVLSVVALLAGSLIFGRTGRRAARRPDGHWLRDPRWRRRFLLVPVLAVLLAFTLRTARDTVLWGELAPSIVGQGAVRQVAVATNNTFYDALLLYLDDWPDRFDLTGGADFVDGSVSAVPSVLVGPQDPFVSPAVQLAQTYIDRNNGFPATPVGDWYVNFGFPGIVLGGLLSGLVVRAAQLAFRRFARDPLVWGFSLVFMIRIFPGGVWATSAPKWVAFGLPILAFTWLVNMFVRRAREGRDGSSRLPPTVGADALDTERKAPVP